MLRAGTARSRGPHRRYPLRFSRAAVSPSPEVVALREVLGLAPQAPVVGAVAWLAPEKVLRVLLGLPLFVLKAMSAGRPVIGTRVGGIPEEVLDGETGLLVPPGDGPSLAGAIVRLLQDRALSRPSPYPCPATGPQEAKDGPGGRGGVGIRIGNGIGIGGEGRRESSAQGDERGGGERDPSGHLEAPGGRRDRVVGYDEALMFLDCRGLQSFAGLWKTPSGILLRENSECAAGDFVFDS